MTERGKTRLAVMVFFFVSGFSFATWASRIPSLQQKLHMNEAQLGTALFAMPLGLMLTLPFTKILLSKYSSRQVMLAGSVLYSFFLALLGWVTHMWQLMAVLFLFGASRNLMNIPVNAQSVGVQTLYPKSVISSFHGVWSLSGFLASALGGWMITHNISPAIHFGIVSAILILLMVVFYQYTYKHDAPAPKATKTFFSLPDKALLKIGVMGFACMACEGTMYDWSGVYFAKAVNAPQSLQTLGYTAFMCAAATGRFVGDWFVNRIGIKKVLMICGILIAAGLFLSAALPYLGTATAGFILAGFGVSCVIPLTMKLAGGFAGNTSAAQAIASASTVSYFGFLIGPPIIGYIAQAANLRWSFAWAGLMGLVIVWLMNKLQLQSKP